MKTIIAIFVFLVCITSNAQNKYFADKTAVKLLTGLMFNEKSLDTNKMAAGFFIGAELELPMSPKSIGNSFVPYFVPELNYWQVENTKNMSIGMNLRGKFKAGSTRPYIDFGVTYNRVTLASVEYYRAGINGGAGIDIQLGRSNISVVIDFKARAIIYESEVRTGFSLTPGIRISF